MLQSLRITAVATVFTGARMGRGYNKTFQSILNIRGSVNETILGLVKMYDRTILPM